LNLAKIGSYRTAIMNVYHGGQQERDTAAFSYHAAHLSGSLQMQGGIVDFSGNVDRGNRRLRGIGTIQDPIWQLISPSPR
jgi:hypothetical protein